MLLLYLKFYKLRCVRNIICISAFCFALSSAYAQNVASIDGKPISTKEFMWTYKKSHNGNVSTDLDSLKNYLNLYINFKLKVLDAKEMGLDKTESYQDEINTFEQALKNHKSTTSTEKDYNLLMSEYREGVLMFNASEQKIWNKAQQDDTGAEAFYKSHLAQYKKSYPEVRAEVIADYQDNLEKEWINSLRKKYKIKIFENELKKMAKI